MITTKCIWCGGKGYQTERESNSYCDDYGELKRVSCIVPCHDGVIRYKTTESKCLDCDGHGYIEYTQDRGGIIPGFRKKSWTKSCNDCLGTGKEIKVYFPCNDCKNGWVTRSSKERGLFGWKNVKTEYKCEKCKGIGFRLSKNGIRPFITI